MRPAHRVWVEIDLHEDDYLAAEKAAQLIRLDIKEFCRLAIHHFVTHLPVEFSPPAVPDKSRLL